MRFNLVNLLLFICFLTAVAPAAAQAVQRTPHRDLPEFDLARERVARIVVKFFDDSGVRAVDGHVQLVDEKAAPPLGIAKELSKIDQLVHSAGLRFDPLFIGSDEGFAQARRRATAAWKKPTADLPTYLQIALPGNLSQGAILALVSQLQEFSSTEVAYPEPIASPPQLPLAPKPDKTPFCADHPLDASVGNLAPLQGYLHSPPAGINVAQAHAFAGGRGEGVRVVDIEAGYAAHSDHPFPISLSGETNTFYREHGTAVVGVIAAADNGIGVSGIAPSANIRFRSIWNSEQFGDWSEANTKSANVANNIYWAAKQSQRGVVLIELQRPGPVEPDCPCGIACSASPVEYWPAEFDAIQTAVGTGVVVVEASGNGARSLDHPVFDSLFDRSVRDSGAIIVAASKSDGVTPTCDGIGANFGTRIDLHSWGMDVATTGATGGKLFPQLHICNNYTENFSGSSSASAIVAGAVASLQGIHRQLTGEPMQPIDLVNLMVSTGTPQAAGTEVSLPIGPQPDLGAAAHLLTKSITP